MIVATARATVAALRWGGDGRANGAGLRASASEADPCLTYDSEARRISRIGHAMPPDEYARIPEADLRSFDLALLQGLGLSADHAGILADNLIAADMRGVRTHGHVMLPRYCDRMRDGSTSTTTQPRIINETPATVHVDGDRAPGAVAGHFTMQAVIRKAGAGGAATGFTKGSNHFGAAAHFAMMALPHRMIGFAATNAGPTMFPFGGRERIVGNNPIAFAIPAARKRPIVLDMAMSVSANSRVMIAERLGQRVPEGWILDQHGQPSTDPADMADGAGVSIGGPKGIGLSQVVDLLAGVLAGASFGPDVQLPRPDGTRGATGHWFHAIDIAAFMPPDAFTALVDQQIGLFHDCARVEGTARIFVPGEIEWERFDESRELGVPLLPFVVDDLNAQAGQTGSSERL